VRKNFFLLFSLISFYSFSQKTQNEFSAKYPLGNEVFKKELSQALNVDNIKGNGKDTCYVRFVVERDGSLSNIIAEGKNNSFNKEAERALMKLNPKWTPGSINNVLVRSRFKVPLYIDFGK